LNWFTGGVRDMKEGGPKYGNDEEVVLDKSEQGEETMGARKKLNRAAVNACALVAGIIGAASGSWVVFGIALAVAVGLSAYSGDIRLKPRRRP
jgi:hypothetical protein